MAQAARDRVEIEAQLNDRAARLAPLPRPLSDYAGTYYSPTAGTMEWRVVASGLELRMGVVQSRAEVFDADANQLRVEVTGGGDVVEFAFPETSGPASSVSMYDGLVTFQRIETP